MAKQHKITEVSQAEFQSLIDVLQQISGEFEGVLAEMKERDMPSIAMKAVPTMELGINHVLNGLRRAKEGLGERPQQEYKLGEPFQIAEPIQMVAEQGSQYSMSDAQREAAEISSKKPPAPTKRKPRKKKGSGD